MPKPATKPDRLKEAHDKLLSAVESITTGDDWQRMLRTAAKFHNYSFNNHLMIFLQRPDATVVAGFNRWKSLGRFVKKGEKGIAIFAPCKYPSSVGPEAATADGESEERKTMTVKGFRVVHVFDISQTEGENLPDLDAVRPKLLEADAPEGIWDALVAQAEGAGFEVIRNQRGSENGYCDFSSKQIAVRPDLDGLQAVKTLVHEVAHAVLHGEGPQPSRDIAKVEVESVAFVVLDALGLSSDAYSFPYVTQWADGDVEVVNETGDRVITCARSILSAMELSSAEVAAPSAASG